MPHPHRRQLALAVEKGFLNLAKQVFRQVERLLQAQLLLADGLGEQRVTFFSLQSSWRAICAGVMPARARVTSS